MVFGLAGSVAGVGLWLSKPARASIGPPPAGLPGALTVQIASPSGSRLHGWWVPGRVGGGIVVLLHGVRGNRLGMVRRAQVLQAHGFSVLLFDFQAHGESPGRRITFGHLERLDAHAAVVFARAQEPQERIGAIGISLGGAAALLGPDPLPVDALVLESVYTDILTALADRLHLALGPVLGWLFTPVLVPAFAWLSPPITGIDAGELRPIDRIAAVTAPLLLVSGTADRHTLIAEAEALYARAPEPKRFWAVPGAGHVDLERFGPERYWANVLPFLAAELTRAR